MTERKRQACGLLRGTWISRPNDKLTLIEDLRLGDAIATLDHGPMPIIRIEAEEHSASQVWSDPSQWPWIYTPDQMEDDGLYLRGDQLILWAPGGCTDTLISARDLARCHQHQCRRLDGWPASVTWYRLHLEGHQIIVADGYPVGSARVDPEIALCRHLINEVSEWA